MVDLRQGASEYEFLEWRLSSLFDSDSGSWQQQLLVGSSGYTRLIPVVRRSRMRSRKDILNLIK